MSEKYNEKNEHNILQEDEIDLKELFTTIWNKKIFILTFTFIVTLLATLYIFNKTPIYEVKSNIKLGFIGDKLINEPNSLVQELKVSFNVDEPILNGKDPQSWVEHISSIKNVSNYIEIKTHGLSNESALEKNKEVVQYIQKIDKQKVDNFIRNTNVSILQAKKDLQYVDKIEIKDVQWEINKLKTQTIFEIDAKIEKLKTQDIKNITTSIDLVNNQKIPEIDDKIKILNNKLNILQNKINFNTEKLSAYNSEINKLFQQSKTQDSTSSMISSIQMINYQNLILNTQNKIEDLHLEQNIIKTQEIPNLLNKKQNLKEIEIDNLKTKIQNIQNIDILNLQIEKENITSDTIKKLEEKINITLKDKKILLENKIKNLEYTISDANINNSKIVNDYVIYENPIKPKKKLVVVVACVSGFIVAIFLVFFMTFIARLKEEQK